MVGWFISIVLLITGIISNNANVYIASGLFAIAGSISLDRLCANNKKESN